MQVTFFFFLHVNFTCFLFIFIDCFLSHVDNVVSFLHVILIYSFIRLFVHV